MASLYKKPVVMTDPKTGNPKLAPKLSTFPLPGATAGNYTPSFLGGSDLAVPEKARGQVGPAEAASLADQPWWEVFKDPTLQQLVDESLKTGYDVRLAAARVEEARAVAGIARADF